MRKSTLIPVVLAAVVCAAAWSQGGRPEGPRPGGMGEPMMICPAMASMPPPARMIAHMSGALGLTQSQAARMKSIAARSEKGLRALRQSDVGASRAFRAALTAPKYDAKRARELASKAESAEARVVSASIDTWTQMRSVLTAKQAAQLARMMPPPPPGPGRGPNGPPPPGEGGFPPPPGPGF